MLALSEDGDLPQSSLTMQVVLENILKLFDGYLLSGLLINRRRYITIAPLTNYLIYSISRTTLPILKFVAVQPKFDRNSLLR